MVLRNPSKILPDFERYCFDSSRRISTTCFRKFCWLKFSKFNALSFIKSVFSSSSNLYKRWFRRELFPLPCSPMIKAFSKSQTSTFSTPRLRSYIPIHVSKSKLFFYLYITYCNFSTIRACPEIFADRG